MANILIIAGIGLLAAQLPFAMFVGKLLKNCREWDNQHPHFMEIPDAD